MHRKRCLFSRVRHGWLDRIAAWARRFAYKGDAGIKQPRDMEGERARAREGE